MYSYVDISIIFALSFFKSYDLCENDSLDAVPTVFRLMECGQLHNIETIRGGGACPLKISAAQGEEHVISL